MTRYRVMRNQTAVTRLTLSLVAAFCTITTVLAESPAQIHSEPITIFLIDDQTGEELATKHGIQPLTTSDLDVLINAVLQRKTPIRLFCGEVIEDASAALPVDMKFRPYAGAAPPTPPVAGLPLPQLVEETRTYREKRAVWQKAIFDYRQQLVHEVERFVRDVTELQMSIAKRFDDELRRRNGHDFNRSDIVGSVTTANRMLGVQGKRLLLLNTDAEDEPAKRRPRTTPLSTAELDPAIELIWVNKSKVPDASPLFRGVPNRVHHADNLAEAMEFVIQFIGEDDSKEANHQASVTGTGTHAQSDATQTVQR